MEDRQPKEQMKEAAISNQPGIENKREAKKKPLNKDLKQICPF